LHAILIAAAFAIIGFAASGNVALTLSESHIISQPRYQLGFGAFLGVLAVIATRRLPNPNQAWANGIRSNKTNIALITNLVVGALFYLNLMQGFVFSSAIAAQKDAFNTQSAVLIAQLGPFYRDGDIVALDEDIFFDSARFINATRNFPILSQTVESNNSFMHWPNTVRFAQLFGSGSVVAAQAWEPCVSGDKLPLLESSRYVISRVDETICVMRVDR
jgi:hypothetical protein